MILALSQDPSLTSSSSSSSSLLSSSADNVVDGFPKNNPAILKHFLALIESSFTSSNSNNDGDVGGVATQTYIKDIVDDDEHREPISLTFKQLLNDYNGTQSRFIDQHGSFQTQNSTITLIYDNVYNLNSEFITEDTEQGQQQQQQQPQLRVYSSYEELELLSKNWQICIIMLYTLTAILALVGNILAICVLTWGKRSSKELRIFLVNLSMADILTGLFSIPFTYLDFMLGRWIFAPGFCPIVQQMQITCVFVSVYTLTAIGIDRYMAIIHPLFSQKYNRSFGPVTITIIWLLGFLLGLFQWANSEAEPFLIANETNYDCKEISNDHSQYFTIIIFLITFALPMTILTFTYFSIGIKIFRHSTPGNADVVRDRAQQSSKIKIMKMLVTIVIMFVVCWLPLQILNLFIYFARDLMVDVYNSQSGFTIYVTIAFTAHWFSMANSFVNPIIYCFMSENFRADLRDLFSQCLRRLNLCVTHSSSPTLVSMDHYQLCGHRKRSSKCRPNYDVGPSQNRNNNNQQQQPTNQHHLDVDFNSSTQNSRQTIKMQSFTSSSVDCYKEVNDCDRQQDQQEEEGEEEEEEVTTRFMSDAHLQHRIYKDNVEEEEEETGGIVAGDGHRRSKTHDSNSSSFNYEKTNSDHKKFLHSPNAHNQIIDLATSKVQYDGKANVTNYHPHRYNNVNHFNNINNNNNNNFNKKKPSKPTILFNVQRCNVDDINDDVGHKDNNNCIIQHQHNSALVYSCRISNKTNDSSMNGNTTTTTTTTITTNGVLPTSQMIPIGQTALNPDSTK